MHTVYLMSDLHLGAGRIPSTGDWDRLEDFFVDDEFCAFITHISASQAPVELIIAGDFIDYPQVLPDLALTSPANDLGCTEAESLERTQVVLGARPDVASGHPRVFARLRQFLHDGHYLTILAGNHDIDLLWPQVWRALSDAICPTGAEQRLHRTAFSYIVGTASGGRVYIEHGQERDATNSFGDEMRAPFADDTFGTQRLKRCWGTLFVDNVYNELERELWFIDNIKPISKVILMGMRDNFPFTASALALIVKFLFASHAPLKQALAMVLGAEESWPAAQRTADAIITSVKDEDLRAALAQQLADPAFRAAFEQELEQFSENDWAAMQAGAAHQPTLDEVVPNAEAPQVLGLFSSDDPYVTAAHAIVSADATITTVVMGHTHAAIDGLTDGRIELPRRMCFYFNSGTWTPHLRERRAQPYVWAELFDPRNYMSDLTYLRLVPNAHGEYYVELHSWRAECGTANEAA